ncbi:MAG TPA: hypothetical protein VLA49_03905 [Anaerolineales bacterium]|nr:hypothetical protein [Anaerolineales bacterium]
MGATPKLRQNLTKDAQAVRTSETTWRLEVPPGPAGSYRLSQLDDYTNLNRREFPWQPPVHLRLRARASQAAIPGTWGFGFWNDPFSLAFGLGGGTRRLPALPNAAWFFFASPQNYLSLRDDLPANGCLAATFQSRNIPSPLLAPVALALPLLFLPPAARLLRRLGRRFFNQSAADLVFDVTAWHQYEIEWTAGQVIFRCDNRLVHQTGIVPHGPLGLVIWVDNQYAAFPPLGQLRYGTLPAAESCWIEIDQLEVS